MGKYAIVTGGARGLGEGIALKLGSMGYSVVVNFVSDRSREKAETVVSKLKDLGVDGLAVQADVSDYGQAKKLVEESVKKFGPAIDVLVNNAGVEPGAVFDAGVVRHRCAGEQRPRRKRHPVRGSEA